MSAAAHIVQSPFNWAGKPITTRIKKSPQTQLFTGLRDPSIRRGGITVVGAEQGRADAHRRDSIKRAIA